MTQIFDKLAEAIKEGADSLKTIKEDKEKYKAHMKRVEALPESYRFAFKKISDYMWANYAGFDGYDMCALLEGVLELFEDAAARGESVMELTGDNPAAFCHDLLKNVPTTRDIAADKLNRQIERHK